MTQGAVRSLIVTGVNGFVGRHVAEEAAKRGYLVHGIARTDDFGPRLRTVASSLHHVDLRDEWPEDVNGHTLIHLAGRAAVGPSFAHPQQYISDNSAIMTTIGEQALRGAVSGRMLVVSTGAVYAAEGNQPITEDAPLLASSPYAVSKILVERQAEYYRRRGLDTVVARPFNHIGPGQGLGFLVPDLYAQVKSLSADAPLLAGNLTTRRDYTDVRDIARAYLDIIEAPSLKSDVYNVASSRSHSGEDILRMICDAAGYPMPRIEQDPARFRPGDSPEIVGSGMSIASEIGWKPEIEIDSSIADFVRGMELTG